MYEWAKYIIISSGADEYINKTEVFKMLEDHRRGKVDHYRTLWFALVFMTWHKLYIEQFGNTKQRILSWKL